MSYLTMWLLTLQLSIKNSIDRQEKLKLNLHSLSVSELLEYGRYRLVAIGCPRLSADFPTGYCPIDRGSDVYLRFNVLIREDANC